jgi:hypothetical protein
MERISEQQTNWGQLEQLAQGWGKLLAGEAFPGGVGLDVDFFTMEEVAVTAAKALIRGALETMSEEQAKRLGLTVACPKCGKQCAVEQRCRAIQVRGAATPEVVEPMAHCPACRRDFFPSAAAAEARRSSV